MVTIRERRMSPAVVVDDVFPMLFTGDVHKVRYRVPGPHSVTKT